MQDASGSALGLGARMKVTDRWIGQQGLTGVIALRLIPIENTSSRGESTASLDDRSLCPA